MAFPILIDGRTTTDEASGNTSIDVRRVTGIQVGQLLVIQLWANRTSNNNNFSTPPGWIKHGFAPGGNQLFFRPRGTIYYKIADGTEVDPVTISWSGSAKCVAFYDRWSGADVDNPVEGFVEVNQANTNDITVPALTTSTPESVAVASVGHSSTTMDYEVFGVGWDPGRIPSSQRSRSGSQGNQDNVSCGYTLKDIVLAESTLDVLIDNGSAVENMTGFEFIVRGVGAPPPVGGTLEIGDGVEFVSGVPKVFDGVDFVTTVPRVFDGANFIP